MYNINCKVMKKKRKRDAFSLKLASRKLMLIMKIGFILLFTVFIQLPVSGFAQKIVIKNGKTTYKQVFSEIHKQANIVTILSNDEIDLNRDLQIETKSFELKQLLYEITKDTELTYELIENYLVIKPLRSKEKSSPNQATQQPKKRLLTGTVKDEEGNPLPGVSVVIKGTNIGVATDVDGNYSLEFGDDDVVLVFSFIGMISREIKYEGQASLNLVLKEDSKQVEEVVVTGIFRKNKASYTGASITVSGEELRNLGTRNIITKLSYIDPGLEIAENNALGSNPNRLPEVSIRGNSSLPNVNELQDNTRAALNTPLVILDGFESSLVTLYDLNENDVESVTILKDASATAIYGTRGANGVIVISTRTPVMGSLKVNYSVDVNIETPDLSSYNLLNAREKLELEKRVGRWDGHDQYNDLLNDVNSGVDTDWMAQPLRTGLGQTHSIRIDGGDKTFRYSASIRYRNTKGVMKESERNILNGGITLSYYYKNLRFTNSLMINEQNQSDSPYGIFSEYATMNPYLKIRDEAGNLILNYTASEDGYIRTIGNPLYNGELNTYMKSNYSNLTNNFMLEWNLKPELVLTGRIGVSKRKNESDDFKPATHTYFMNKEAYEGENIFKKGSYNYGTGNSTSFDAAVNLRYAKIWHEKHSLFAGVDYNVRESKSYNYSFSTQGFSNEDFDFLPLALKYADQPPGGNEQHTRAIGLVANANYVYDNRYYADFTFRTDGNSQYGSKKRFAPFWAIGLGWNMHEEDFLKGHAVVNFLKLRFSTGITGTQNFSAYQAQTTYEYIKDRNYSNWMGATMKAIGNENLKWQQKMNYNLGLELKMLDSRLSFRGDVYLETTKDMVSSVNIPWANGFNSYVENVGKMENKGFEAGISAFAIKKSNFRWLLSSSIRHNRNEIVEISKALQDAQQTLEQEEASIPNLIYKPGYSTHTIWAVQSLGIDPSTGREVFLDRFGNQSLNWNALDQVDCGIGEPKYRGNITSNLTYKNLSVSLNFGYFFGGKKYNNTLISKVENVDIKKNLDARVYYERWKQPGDVAKFKSIDDSSETLKSSRFVQRENTFTGQNLSVSYQMNKKQIQKIFKLSGMEHLSISFSTSDLFHLSTVKRERGTSYPFSRQFAFSLRTTF